MKIRKRNKLQRYGEKVRKRKRNNEKMKNGEKTKYKDMEKK